MDTPFIQPTPILYGEAARRFERMIQEGRKETPEERERRLRNYRECTVDGVRLKLKKRNDE